MNIPIYLSFLWGRDFQLLVKIALVSAICFLVFRLISRRNLPRKAMKIIYGIIFLPILILPAFRCSFKVPYIFCQACPTKCPWGISRAFIFSGALLMNLYERFWCAYLCPLGTIQARQARASKWNFRLPSWAGYSVYIALLLTIGIYSLSLSGSRLTGYFEAGYYILVWKTMFAAAAIFAAAFFYPMFLCRYMCPVSAIAGICEALKKGKGK